MNNVVNLPVLSTEATQALLWHAAAKAVELGVVVNIAVLDGSALPCGFLRMQGAHTGAVDIAMDKAWTSVSFGGQPTRAIAQRLAGIPEMAREAILRRPRYTPLTGGVPIRLGGALVGSIGVSGAMPDEDEACAFAALAAIGADPIA
jgi:uncharacterized protein GlcG (DUF336 family)